MNHSQKEKQKTTTKTTTRITKLSFALLTSSLLVLSSIAAVQLFVSDNNNAAFAAENCTETVDEETQTVELVCHEGGGGRVEGDDGAVLRSGGDEGDEDLTILAVPDRSLDAGGGGSKPVPDEGG